MRKSCITSIIEVRIKWYEVNRYDFYPNELLMRSEYNYLFRLFIGFISQITKEEPRLNSINLSLELLYKIYLQYSIYSAFQSYNCLHGFLNI